MRSELLVTLPNILHTVASQKLDFMSKSAYLLIKSVEAEFEDCYAPSVEAINIILEDAMANLDHLHLILKRAIP